MHFHRTFPPPGYVSDTDTGSPARIGVTEPRATHDLGQPPAARVHVEPARRAAAEEAARGAAPGTDVADVSRDVAAGLDEHERVRVVRLGGERLRVAGARLVDAEVAAVGGAGQVLPAHVAEERPDVVPRARALGGRSG